MVKTFIEHIANEFKSKPRNVLLVHDSSNFLKRDDVIFELRGFDIEIMHSCKIEQRIAFELKEDRYFNKVLVLLCDNCEHYLEDIKLASTFMVFEPQKYFQNLYLESVLECELQIINILYSHDTLLPFNKSETNKLIRETQQKIKISNFDTVSFNHIINKELNKENTDWFAIAKEISDALLQTIDTDKSEEIKSTINSINIKFQNHIKTIYGSLISSSPIKRPKIVSKILDHINISHKKEKVALIVIDGMNFWQYYQIKSVINNQNLKISDSHTYSWLPSITQLSRQAIFRGNIPEKTYLQNPKNEKKLWFNYWKENGFADFEIRYNHSKFDFTNIQSINRFALVYNDLDDKMHASSNYTDLKDLTENWIQSSSIISDIKQLISNGFIVYLTTDHGNIEAHSWRNLKGKEKLGTNKSGSRSERHIEYSDDWLVDEFIKANEAEAIYFTKKNNAIYFNNDLSFSNKENLITHGGSHFLEVLIPFIKISNARK